MPSEPCRGPSILLIEGDADLRGAMKLVLEWEGYRVACAADGREALDRLRQFRPPAVVLLDPATEHGIFRRAQQQDAALAAIPVVVVSADGDGASLEAAGYLRKPFEVEQLLKAVRHYG